MYKKTSRSQKRKRPVHSTLSLSIFILLQGNPCFKYRNFFEAAFLVLQFFSTGYSTYKGDEFFEQCVHIFPFQQLTGIEIDPIALFVEQLTVGRYFHGRHKASEGCAPSGGKEDQLTAAEAQGRCCHQVVARRRKQVQAVLFQGLGVLQYIYHRSCAPLLGTSQRFVLQSGNAPVLISR